MRCPKCNNNVYSHHQKINKSGTEIKRYYACSKCKHVFETIEQIIKTDEEDKMIREEWYKHTTLDNIESVQDYIQNMLDGAMETDMDDEDIENLHHLLIVLHCDISKQLNKFK